MTIESLRELLTRHPFEPLRITITSGAVFEVRHPEMAAVGRSRLVVVLPDVDGQPSDRCEYLSYLHIAHVQTVESSGRAA